MPTIRLFLCLAFLLVCVARSARADVTGDYDGTLTAKKAPQPMSVSATFTPAGKTVTGTIALPADVATFGGEYLVHGKVTPKRLKVSGGGGHGGAFLRWQAKIVGGTLQGKIKLKGAISKLNGTLTLTLNTSTTDGSSCDGVYQANQTFFADQMVVQLLPVCASCHGPGLQAQSTRFRVNSADPLATARTIAMFVDSADPANSRILMKPLNLIPHGGGVRLEKGTAPEPILEQWVALVAAAHCD
jgi:hypothetical protein